MAQKAGTWANIPLRWNRKGCFVFSKWLYRQRNLVERIFNKLKQFRGIATRYGKRIENYLAAVKLASIRIWLRSLWVCVLNLHGIDLLSLPAAVEMGQSGRLLNRLRADNPAATVANFSIAILSHAASGCLFLLDHLASSARWSRTSRNATG